MKKNRVKEVVKKMQANGEHRQGRSFLTPTEWQEVHRYYMGGGNLQNLWKALPGPKHRTAHSFQVGYLQWRAKHGGTKPTAKTRTARTSETA